MIDTSLILGVNNTPMANIPEMIRNNQQAAAELEGNQLINQQRQQSIEAGGQRMEQGQQQFEQQQQTQQQEQDRAGALRKASVIHGYASQLRQLPMAQRRTFLASIPEDVISDLGIDPSQVQGMAIDDASIDTTLSQLEPLLQQGQSAQQNGARRSESMAGGRITMQELDDGTVRYLEFGEEIPQDQVRDRINAAQQAYTEEQRNLSGARRGGALGAEIGVKGQIASEVEQAKKEAGGEESRAQAIINSGVDASYQLPTIKRTIDLLDEIETGGINSVALRIKQAFGVEGADEGELSGNLGKAVLTQLRETFGAAFTEGEGKRLERIEANFGKNAETNKRLLGNVLELAERKVDRAIERAKTRGDDETVAELESNLQYRIGDKKKAKQAQSEAPQPAPVTGFKFLGFE